MRIKRNCLLACRYRMFKRSQAQQPNTPENPHTMMTVRALLNSSAFLLLLTAYNSAEEQPTCKAIWYENIQALSYMFALGVSTFCFVFPCKNKTEDFPFHRLFKLYCSEAARALVNLVDAWSSQQECDDNQERCMYQVI